MLESNIHNPLSFAEFRSVISQQVINSNIDDFPENVYLMEFRESVQFKLNTEACFTLAI